MRNSGVLFAMADIAIFSVGTDNQAMKRTSSQSGFCAFLMGAVAFCVVISLTQSVAAQDDSEAAASSDSATFSSAGPVVEPSAEQQALIRDLLAQLGSKSFESRADASKNLKALPIDQFQYVCQLAGKQASAEVIIRIMAELDNRYSVGQDKDLLAVSESLEQLATAERLLVADSAEASLLEHSQKRLSVVQQQLRDFGALVGETPGVSNMFLGVAPRTLMSAQVFFTDDWKGGEQGLRVFARLASLMKASNGVLTVYLVDGNSLSAADVEQIAEFVGHARIAERSPVALGIVNDGRMNFGGVLISQVTPGGTAEKGGLHADDLLLAMEPAPARPPKQVPAKQDGDSGQDEEVEPQEQPVIIPWGTAPLDTYLEDDPRRLLDFDDLVERLKKYKIGDEVLLHVVRRSGRLGFRAPRGNEVELTRIKLMGWKDMSHLRHSEP